MASRQGSCSKASTFRWVTQQPPPKPYMKNEYRLKGIIKKETSTPNTNHVLKFWGMSFLSFEFNFKWSTKNDRKLGGINRYLIGSRPINSSFSQTPIARGLLSHCLWRGQCLATKLAPTVVAPVGSQPLEQSFSHVELCWATLGRFLLSLHDSGYAWNHISYLHWKCFIGSFMMFLAKHPIRYNHISCSFMMKQFDMNPFSCSFFGEKWLQVGVKKKNWAPDTFKLIYLPLEVCVVFFSSPYYTLQYIPSSWCCAKVMHMKTLQRHFKARVRGPLTPEE